jgi:hypothetical protein
LIGQYPIADRRVIHVGRSFVIDTAKLEAFPVEHSVRAPAVGFRVSIGGTCLFYVPDVVPIRNRRAALQRVSLYTGDGARIERPLLRRKDHRTIGHTTIRVQLGWCRREAVKHAIFTHCGTEIVRSGAHVVAARVRRLG